MHGVELPHGWGWGYLMAGGGATLMSVGGGGCPMAGLGATSWLGGWDYMSNVWL